MKPSTLIFGPCSAESESQLLRIAASLKSQLSVPFIFRAGLWKPRTSPDTFQGVGDIGLQWLQRIRHDFDLPVATEVSTPDQLLKALDAGIDYLWIGARTSANPILVQHLADTLSDYLITNYKPQTTNPKPSLVHSLKGIFVKNPVNNDPDLWLGNLRRLTSLNLHSFNVQPYAIHRGCAHHPCWSMAYRLRQEMPDIPLLLDPSHMSGDASKVPGLCAIAAELGYDGLMVEVHDDPAHALSDASQQLTPTQLASLIEKSQTTNYKLQTTNYNATSLNAKRSSESPLSPLKWLRRIMDEVDDELWSTLARRMDISRLIGEYKRDHGMDVVQPSRFDAILSHRLEWAKENGLSPEAVRLIMDAIHAESIRIQTSL